jgi:hypothetical protein
MMSLDGFVFKSDGIGELLSRITGFRQIDPAGPTLFALEHDALIEAVNWWATREPSQECVIMFGSKYWEIRR